MIMTMRLMLIIVILIMIKIDKDNDNKCNTTTGISDNNKDIKLAMMMLIRTYREEDIKTPGAIHFKAPFAIIPITCFHL